MYACGVVCIDVYICMHAYTNVVCKGLSMHNNILKKDNSDKKCGSHSPLVLLQRSMSLFEQSWGYDGEGRTASLLSL